MMDSGFAEIFYACESLCIGASGYELKTFARPHVFRLHDLKYCSAASPNHFSAQPSAGDCKGVLIYRRQV